MLSSPYEDIYKRNIVLLHAHNLRLIYFNVNFVIKTQ